VVLYETHEITDLSASAHRAGDTCPSSGRYMPTERAIHAHQAGIRYNIFLYVIPYIMYSAIFYITYK
jgi:hypothetical protein